MKILAVDYGDKHFGLAVSEGEIARPLGKASSRQRVISICREQGIEKIIIGLSEGKMAEKTRKFAEELQKITGLPVEYQDETLTSQKAVEKLVEAGKKKSQRKSSEHAAAACLILQEWLDNLN